MGWCKCGCLRVYVCYSHYSDLSAYGHPAHPASAPILHPTEIKALYSRLSSDVPKASNTPPCMIPCTIPLFGILNKRCVDALATRLV